VALGLAAALFSAPEARGQEFPAVTDRDFTLDLHQGTVLGSGNIVGMGGTAVATGQGSSGALFNPAAAAVRSDRSTSAWDWDWHFDWLTPQLGSDHDNNGIAEEVDRGFGEGLFTFGGVVQYRGWGLALGFLFFTQPHPTEDVLRSLESTVAVARIALARSFWRDQITVGFGVKSGQYWLTRDDDIDLFSIVGSGIEAGAVWRPTDLNLRAGASAGLPVASERITDQQCDPLDCEGFILPERAALPWQASAGIAWRLADTRWNRVIETRWRDEKYVLLAADLVVTGRVADGHGIEAFAQHQLQPSGRDIGLSPRGGVEYEWVPGRFRVRGGSYWEPSRFRDPSGDSVPGRLHVTLGLDLRIWQFGLFGGQYRLRLSSTADAAPGYGNGGLSIGLWR
jgi:hypothetical protein